MSHSQRPRLRDLREIYLLVGECRELKDDPAGWRGHFFRTLNRLTDSLVTMGGLMVAPGSPDVSISDVVEVGWPSEACRSHWLRYQRDGMHAKDETFIGCDWLRARHVVRSREQVAADRAWYASAGFNEYRRPAEQDDWIISSVRLDPGWGGITRPVTDMATVHRPLGARRFGARERRLVWLAHRELGPLVGRTLRTSADDPFAALPPRLRRTLDRLLAGDSEKEAANALGLGARTVQEYVVDLYRRFGVHSRAELMAHCHRTRQTTNKQT